MMEQTKLMKFSNNLYIYLLITLLSSILILVTFSLLLIPTLITNFRIIRLFMEKKIDAHSTVLRIYLIEFKKSMKYLKYILLSIYLLLVLSAISISPNFIILVINIVLSISTIFVILCLTWIASQEDHRRSLGKIYKIYISQISIKHKLIILTISLMLFLSITTINLEILLLSLVPIICFTEYLLTKQPKEKYE